MKRITSFRLQEGDVLSRRYKIIQKLGRGWEGEVYLVEEKSTGIERSIKIFFPHRNKGNRNLTFYAKKLHKLRSCDILIQYHTQEEFKWKGQEIPYLVSEYVEGELLSKFLKTLPNGRMSPFQALHLLHALAKGLEQVHRLKEYHGDLHTENIIVQRYGLGFDLKLVDLFHWETSTRPENIQDDICDMIRICHEVLGGQKRYSKQPDAIKSIILGRRKAAILKKFRTTTKLLEYVENLEM